MTGSDVRIYSYDYKLNIVAAKELCSKHEASHLTTMSQIQMLYTIFLDMELILKDIYIPKSEPVGEHWLHSSCNNRNNCNYVFRRPQEYNNHTL